MATAPGFTAIWTPHDLPKTGDARKQPNKKKNHHMIATSPLARIVQRTLAVLACSLTLVIGMPQAQAKQAKHLDSLSAIPTITGITLNAEGDLVAAGTVDAEVKGKTVTVSFADIPVHLTLADNQPLVGAPVLDLELDPIDLNLLGLLIETGPICLRTQATPAGGALGNLLTTVGNLLKGGTTVENILGAVAITPAQRDQLLAGLDDIFNEVLGVLEGAVVTDIEHKKGRICATISLELAPSDHTLLGLNVHVDDCEGGPVTVELSARKGQLLGNLLCRKHHKKGHDIEEGDTLGDLLDGLLED